jgi:hypothetical protein
MECPICLEPLPKSIFINSCGHVMCKCCLNKMVEHGLTACPMCREKIMLNRQPPENLYTRWLLDGGQPVIRWRRKRSNKYFNRFKSKRTPYINAI